MTAAPQVTRLANSGVTADPLFVAATRPAMRWGVTYSALLFMLVLTLELFLLSRNLLVLLLIMPLYAIAALLCAGEPRFFDLLLLWARTRVPAYLGSYRYWRATSYSALAVDLPDRGGRRRRDSTVVTCAVRTVGRPC